MDAQVVGTLRYDAENRCFLLEQETGAYPAVWPAGTEAVADGPGVELPDGLIVTVGDEVSGGGGYLTPGSGLIDDIEIPAACLPATDEVAVFNSEGEVTAPE